jgi:flagellar hook-basal body complex protein FliE
MSVDALNSQTALLQKMAALKGIAGGDTIALQPEAAGGDFLSSMKTAMDRVNTEQNRAGELMAAVDTGQSDDLVGAMVASQKAGLSFSALMQVRNKLMSGFDEIMRLSF